ncbi:hypothetical protein PHYSODRAFT_492562 [Phytophthora sojae]|uniref:Elicitin n=2 Tax=Phytophthora sojae TaxID=67593 RepID=G4Z3M8_PHYSP|nr:hypothetical protein PHYSODRAFT_492562 [Phytophthora sojae]ABB56019.1 elicitin-like protein SOL1B [Phytophthora sojae]EGZ20097.1 hypothetical protein PHYSODRAFT_492562 [Phytophthora sojae]|eukprot:XP_009522814.1 hypothetical protein PHYSODRAFT_492562 [Phytophthora sojae]
MRVVVAVAAVVVAQLFTGTAAASCDSTSIETLLTSTDATTCTSDSGYSITSLLTPSGSEMALMCTSTACQTVIGQLKALSPSECTIGTFALYANLITPLSGYCSSVPATATSSSSRRSTNTTTSSGVEELSQGSSGMSESGSSSGIEPGSWCCGGGRRNSSGGVASALHRAASTKESSICSPRPRKCTTYR